MNKYLLLVFSLVFNTALPGQRLNVDSLEATLVAQPGTGVRRMHTLLALSKATKGGSNIQSRKAAQEAGRIAEAVGNDSARCAALAQEALVVYLSGDLDAYPTLNRDALALAQHNGYVSLMGQCLVLKHCIGLYTDTLPDYTADMRKAIGLLRSAKDSTNLAWALLQWSLNSANPDMDGRADSLALARSIHERSNDRSGIAQCIMGGMFIHFYRGGHYADFALRLDTAIALAQQAGDRTVLIDAYINAITMYLNLADHGRALEAGLAGIAQADAYGAPTSIAAVNSNTGYILLDLDELERATAYFRAAIAANGWKSYDIGARTGLAMTFLKMHLPDSAIQGLQAALDRYGGAIDPGDMAEIDGLMAEALAMNGDTLRAIGLYRRSIALARASLTAEAIAAQRSVELGHLLLDTDPVVLHAAGSDREQAVMEADSLFTFSLAFGNEVGALREQMHAQRGLARVAEAHGRIPEALAHYKTYLVLRDSVLNADKMRAVNNLQIRYDTEKKEQRIVLLGKDKEVQAKEIQKQKLVRNGFMGGFVLVALFAGVFLFQRNRIGKEKARSEELLLNILPEEVAEELKAKGEAEARHIDHVTVLFTDFKGFTAMSEQLTPKELVRDIHECFSAFDRICEKYGIEKIKTIGDAYMAAGGLPTPNTTHALDVVQAALEIRDFIAEGKTLKIAKGLPYFEIRIGVHTGPVVAGIVGVKKFAYDIWGDTVNIASRMESSGEVGQVNISEATYALVKDAKKVDGEWSIANGGSTHSPTPIHHSPHSDQPAFTFTARGKVQAKGKGEMEMYFALRSSGANA